MCRESWGCCKIDVWKRTQMLVLTPACLGWYGASVSELLVVQSCSCRGQRRRQRRAARSIHRCCCRQREQKAERPTDRTNAKVHADRRCVPATVPELVPVPARPSSHRTHIDGDVPYSIHHVHKDLAAYQLRAVCARSATMYKRILHVVA